MILESRNERIFKVFTVTIILIITAACLFPFLYIVSVSFSGKNPVMRGEVFLWPKGWDLSAYRTVFNNQALMRAMRFTIVLTLVHTVICVIMTVMAAYPLSKPDLKYKTPILLFILFTMYFSGGMIPGYLNIKQLGLIDTFWVLILPGCLSTYNMILMKSFFQAMPREMEESAFVDGANDAIVLVRIILPLSKAMLATAAAL